MNNLLNFVLFQGGWFLAVWGASQERMWWGPIVFGLICVWHVLSVPDRRAELRYLLLAGLLGMGLDTGLKLAGALAYPTSVEAWPYLVVPPWITSLWVGFATLPRYSLGWLRGKPTLAVLLGAVGGPLSFLGGTRFGSVGVGEPEWWTWLALSVEYACVTPLLLWWAPSSEGEPAAASLRSAS